MGATPSKDPIHNGSSSRPKPVSRLSGQQGRALANEAFRLHQQQAAAHQREQLARQQRHAQRSEVERGVLSARQQDTPLLSLSKTTGFSLILLRRLHVLFGLISGCRIEDDLIDPHELSRALGLRRDSFLFLTLFRLFDMTHSNAVNFPTWVLTLSALSPQASFEEKVRFSFRLLDVNGDGTIEQEEIIHLIVSAIHAAQWNLTDGSSLDSDSIHTNDSDGVSVISFLHVTSPRQEELKKIIPSSASPHVQSPGPNTVQSNSNPLIHIAATTNVSTPSPSPPLSHHAALGQLQLPTSPTHQQQQQQQHIHDALTANRNATHQPEASFTDIDLSEREIRDLALRTLQEADIDGNGEVSFDEYCAMMARSGVFMNLFTIDIDAFCAMLTSPLVQQAVILDDESAARRALAFRQKNYHQMIAESFSTLVMKRSNGLVSNNNNGSSSKKLSSQNLSARMKQAHERYVGSHDDSQQQQQQQQSSQHRRPNLARPSSLASFTNSDEQETVHVSALTGLPFNNFHNQLDGPDHTPGQVAVTDCSDDHDEWTQLCDSTSFIAQTDPALSTSASWQNFLRPTPDQNQPSSRQPASRSNQQTAMTPAITPRHSGNALVSSPTHTHIVGNPTDIAQLSRMLGTGGFSTTAAVKASDTTIGSPPFSRNTNSVNVPDQYDDEWCLLLSPPPATIPEPQVPLRTLHGSEDVPVVSLSQHRRAPSQPLLARKLSAHVVSQPMAVATGPNTPNHALMSSSTKLSHTSQPPPQQQQQPQASATSSGGISFTFEQFTRSDSIAAANLSRAATSQRDHHQADGSTPKSSSQRPDDDEDGNGGGDVEFFSDQSVSARTQDSAPAPVVGGAATGVISGSSTPVPVTAAVAVPAPKTTQPNSSAPQRPITRQISLELSSPYGGRRAVPQTDQLVAIREAINQSSQSTQMKPRLDLDSLPAESATDITPFGSSFSGVGFRLPPVIGSHSARQQAITISSSESSGIDLNFDPTRSSDISAGFDASTFFRHRHSAHDDADHQDTNPEDNVSNTAFRRFPSIDPDNPTHVHDSSPLFLSTAQQQRSSPLTHQHVPDISSNDSKTSPHNTTSHQLTQSMDIFILDDEGDDVVGPINSAVNEFPSEALAFLRNNPLAAGIDLQPPFDPDVLIFEDGSRTSVVLVTDYEQLGVEEPEEIQAIAMGQTAPALQKLIQAMRGEMDWGA